MVFLMKLGAFIWHDNKRIHPVLFRSLSKQTYFRQHAYVMGHDQADLQPQLDFARCVRKQFQREVHNFHSPITLPNARR